MNVLDRVDSPPCLLEHGLVPAPPRLERPAPTDYQIDIPLGATVWTDGSGQFSADPAFRSCAFSLVTDQAGRGSLPGVNESISWAELLAVTLALECLKGSGYIVSECKRVVTVVVALRVGKRPPRVKQIDPERKILRAGAGTRRIGSRRTHTHTSESQRRSLGISRADFPGNDRSDVASKEALPAPNPHLA